MIAVLDGAVPLDVIIPDEVPLLFLFGAEADEE